MKSLISALLFIVIVSVWATSMPHTLWVEYAFLLAAWSAGYWKNYFEPKRK